MVNIQKHLNLLGHRVRDRVTGFEGIVVTVFFDLFGCVQAGINPGRDKDGKRQDSECMDVSRLEVLSETPVMERPNFEFNTSPEAVSAGLKGPADKSYMGMVQS